ncbi:hypothetical protein [Bradyrhizobium canariense]|uniref:Uncharacterized protein n=1 Tax=Bradyrhizobium canariense TaxID=255045 RepID=A0A1H1MZJ8_9BRAD|nr:hypothetical protein [Bradyrhizobium canariense]SDR91359.1 hypothetical protein SAMN05444158_0395 [Bradyrhizobium canariense]
MSPTFNGIIFGILGLAALWGITKNIRTGTATSRGWTCTLDDNPIGFCLIVCVKAAVIGLAIAEIMYALGLSGDPIKDIQHAFPFLPTRP